VAERQLQTSFAAGELSPNLYARVDQAKYKVGAALLRNFFVDFRGGASNRQGTQYLGPCSTPAEVGGTFFNGFPRPIPFIVGSQDGYVLEFGYAAGAGYVNVWQGGVKIVSGIVVPYLLADLALLKYAQSGDVMTICHPNYAPAQITLNANGTWTYSIISIGAVQAMPGTIQSFPPPTTDPDYCYSYLVTAVSLDGKSESLPSAPILVHYTILDETKGLIIPLTWGPSASPTSLYRVYKCGPFDDRVSYSPGTIWGYIGSSQVTAFEDLNIAPDFTKVPPMFGDPFSGGQITSINIATPGSGYPSGESWTGYIPLTFSGSAHGTGATGYLTVDYNGIGRGVFLTSAGKNFQTADGTTVTAGSGGATFTLTFGSYTPTYAAVPGYFQQRQVFGGANNTPNTLVLSQTGDYLNFNTTPITVDSDALVDEIVSGQVNTIKSMLNVSYGLLVFTTGGLFLVSGGAGAVSSNAITPETITDTAQAANGANDLPPILVNYSVIYMQNRGNIVRDCSFAWQRQSYTGTDISTWSNHLFYNFTFSQWWWNEEPSKQVQIIRNDGAMLSLTYVPDQEITAWSHYDTNGYFVGGCSIPEGNYNVVYLVVLRFIAGAWTYTMERFDNRVFNFVEDSWFLDCALQLPQITFKSLVQAHYSNVAPDQGVMQLSGTTLTCLSSVPVFSYASIGNVFWAKGGKATITGITSGFIATVSILEPFPLLPNDPTGSYVLFYGSSSDWSIGVPSTVIGGLSYLNGNIVNAIADGTPVIGLTVSGGQVTLPQAASKVVIGLGYQSQLQTLKIELEGAPTIQGRRKTIPAGSVLIDKTIGISMGQSFTTLDPIDDIVIPFGSPNPLYSGERHVILPGQWDTSGQVCIQQDAPLPCTILGIVSEVEVGDTQK
jgi:hypothetical protein